MDRIEEWLLGRTLHNATTHKVNNNRQIAGSSCSCRPCDTKVKAVFTDLRHLTKKGWNGSFGLWASWTWAGRVDVTALRRGVWLGRSKSPDSRCVLGKFDIVKVFDVAPEVPLIRDVDFIQCHCWVCTRNGTGQQAQPYCANPKHDHNTDCRLSLCCI